MKTTLLALASAMLVLSACETPSDSAGGANGTGTNQYGGSQNVDGTMGELAPGVADRVFFAYDSSTLSSEAQASLQKQANWLKQYSNVNVVVEGHCDERGTREYNLALGERRAAAARNFLVNSGVAASRVTTVSYGKERPAAMGTDESSYGLNRRAVTVITN